MTMDIAVLGLEVKSDSVKTASRDLDGLQKSSGQAETATGKLTSSFTQYAGAIKAVAGAYGLMKVSQYIYEAATLSARYTTLGVVLHRVGENAGYTTQQMDEHSRKLRETGISAIESRSALTRLTQAHIDLSKSSELARLAQDAAVIGNINSSEAFGRLVYGIQSAQVEVLRTIGLNVNFEAGYKRLAKEIGTTTSALTEAQKVQARVEEVMASGTAISGVYSDAMETAGKKMSSLARYAEDAKVEVGKLFEPALAVSIDVATASLKGFTSAMEDLNKRVSSVGAGSSISKQLPWLTAMFPSLANSIDLATAAWRIFNPGASEAASALEHLAKAGDMVERSLAQQAAKSKAEHVDLFGLEEAAARAGDIVGVIKDIVETYQYEREDTAKETAATVVEAEEDAATKVADAWEEAMARVARAIASITGSTPGATAVSSSGFGNQVGLAGRTFQVATRNYAIRSVGSVDGKAYYSQETLSKAMENANADYQRQLVQYEAAVKAAEELRRQWESVLSSYEGLLTSIEDYQPTMSFSALSANLDQATASVEAAKNFLKDLTYYANQLQGYKSGFESLGDRIEAEITARTRAGWGASEYMALYSSLSSQYAGLDTGAADYYDQALEISEDMLDALLSIEDATDAATAATLSLRTSLVGVFGTLDTGIAGLYGSTLAPSQSLEFYTGRYATLYNRASSSLSSEDVGALTQFVQQSYLPFLQSYGGDYQGVFDSTIQDLEALQDATGYSILGTFGTLNEALEQTGAWAEWFAEKLDEAGASALDSGTSAAWLADKLASGEGLTGALGETVNAATNSAIAMDNITTALGMLATNTSTSLSGVVDSLNSLVTTLSTAIASIKNNTGTTVNISAPAAPVTYAYAYDWRFVPTSGSIRVGEYNPGYWTTSHGGNISTTLLPTNTYSVSMPTTGYRYQAAEGLLFTGDAMTRIGEKYPEAAVPLTERHLEPFLRAAGYGRDNIAEDVAAAVKSALGPMMRAGGQGSGNIMVKVVIDGREVGNVVATQMESNSRLVGATKRVARSA